MGYGKQEREAAAQGKGCLGRAGDNEPVFVLRAQDMLAADLVETWATQASVAGCPGDKVVEARRLAQEMREWPSRKNPD